MSVCTSAIVAATKAVSTPIHAINSEAPAALAKMPHSRAHM